MPRPSLTAFAALLIASSAFALGPALKGNGITFAPAAEGCRVSREVTRVA